MYQPNILTQYFRKSFAKVLRYQWRTAYFSPENAPLAYHASKLIEKFTGKRFGRATLSFGEYRQVKEHLEQNFFFISPKDDFKLETILERAQFLVRRKGIKMLVIDPYNRLEADIPPYRSETLYISQVLDRGRYTPHVPNMQPMWDNTNHLTIPPPQAPPAEQTELNLTDAPYQAPLSELYGTLQDEECPF